jgi:3',5'-cyclic AMP phosphodiesterase CpdA
MEWIRSLPGTPIIVPGNHDMAFYNPVRRATQRLSLFRQLVTENPEPFYRDAEITILGLNTARVSHLRDGRIRKWQVDRLEERMKEAAPGTIRVLVTHHPFDLPADYHDRELVGSGREYLPRVVKFIDVLLAGHMHISFAGPTAVRFKLPGVSSAIFVQSGTALSTRTRTEGNSFQVIRTSPDRITAEEWSAGSDTRFEPKPALTFIRNASGEWQSFASPIS